MTVGEGIKTVPLGLSEQLFSDPLYMPQDTSITNCQNVMGQICCDTGNANNILKNSKEHYCVGGRGRKKKKSGGGGQHTDPCFSCSVLYFCWEAENIWDIQADQEYRNIYGVV
jgi:hypothetical protein